MATDEERMAFKRQEREAAASIMAGDRYCPDPELHELVARAASQERPQPTIEQLAAEQGIKRITNVDDLRIDGLTDEEADSFMDALAFLERPHDNHDGCNPYDPAHIAGKAPASQEWQERRHRGRP